MGSGGSGGSSDVAASSGRACSSRVEGPFLSASSVSARRSAQFRTWISPAIGRAMGDASQNPAVLHRVHVCCQVAGFAVFRLFGCWGGRPFVLGAPGARSVRDGSEFDAVRARGLDPGGAGGRGAFPRGGTGGRAGCGDGLAAEAGRGVLDGPHRGRLSPDRLGRAPCRHRDTMPISMSRPTSPPSVGHRPRSVHAEVSPITTRITTGRTHARAGVDEGVSGRSGVRSTGAAAAAADSGSSAGTSGRGVGMNSLMTTPCRACGRPCASASTTARQPTPCACGKQGKGGRPHARQVPSEWGSGLRRSPGSRSRA